MRNYSLEEIYNLMVSQNAKTIRLKRDEDCPIMQGYSSAGPNPCISGKRKNYWGKDAFIAVKGSYIYKIGTKNW